MNNFDRIEDYLKNRMSGVERELFEKEMESNESLAIEFELHKQENIALKSSAFDLLKKNIEELDKENLIDTENEKVNSNSIKPNKIKKSKSFLKQLFIVSAIGLLSLLAYQYLRKQKPNTENEVQKIKEKEEIIKETQNDIKTTIESKNNNTSVSPIDGSKKQKKIIKPPKEEPKKEIEKKTQAKEEPKKEPNYKMMAMANILSESDSWARDDGVTSISNPEWKNIIENYKQAKYKSTIDLANKLSDSHPYYWDAKHIVAKSFLKSSKFLQAEEVYKKLIETEDDFQMDIYQYEMLISLLGQLPQKEKAFKKLFKSVDSNPDFTYGQEINKIKNDLTKVSFSFE